MKINQYLMLFFGIFMGHPAFAQGKTFDFLGFTTNSPAPSESRLSGKKCRIAQSELSSCNIFAGAIIGRARVFNLTVTFNNARLIKVSGFVMIPFYNDLTDALEAKYGPPSQIENRRWQNKLGSSFDNEVRVWSFTDGTLELHQRGSQRDVPEFIFVANHNLPEVAPPPVNF